MPSDLSRKGGLPQLASPLSAKPGRSQGRQRTPPLLKLALLGTGLLCFALWHVGPTVGAAGQLSGTAGRLFDERSSFGAIKAFVEQRAGFVQPSILDPFLREQRHLSTAVGTSPASIERVDKHSNLRMTADPGGLLIKHDGLHRQTLGLFMLWPKDLEASATSSFLLRSYLSSPTSEIAHLVVLVKGDAALCRKISRFVQAARMASVDLTHAQERRLQTVCLSDSEWWEHHKDYLCAGWQCSFEEEERVVQTMSTRDRDDRKDEQLRPIRGLVFDSLLPANVKWWGWLGHDVFTGNLERTLPWDVAHNFDVLIPNGVALHTPSPVALSHELALFQRRESTAGLLLGFTAFQSVATFLDASQPTLSEFSNFLLGSLEASFLSFEAHLTTFGAATFARALTQSGTFTTLLPPSHRTKPTANDRAGYLHLMHAPHVAPHVLGTFSNKGVDRLLAWDEPPVFPPLAPALDVAHKDGRFHNATTWLYRLPSGGPIVARSEPRFVLPRDIVLTEWTFDIVNNHQTDRHQAPPYPPNRLRKGHALVFLPDPKSSSASNIRIKDAIWDDGPAAPGALPNWWEIGKYETPARATY